MTIITENQTVKAGVLIDAGALHIDFAEDSSFVRSESVLIDLMQRSIGLIFQNGYHHIGNLPSNVKGADLEKMANVRLSGKGAGNRDVVLHAPVKIVRTRTV